MANEGAIPRAIVRVFASIVGVVLLGGGGTDRLAGARPAENPEAVAAAKLPQCAACHQADGVSRAEIFPNLAGQQKDYLVEQLTAFRDHTRQDRDAKTYMWGMAAGLTDATIVILAENYAAKSPAAGAPWKKNDLAAGRTIYEKGDATRGVLACASCHGARGEGTTAIPRLAGQHHDYLEVQLRAFSSGARANAVMHLIAVTLTPKEVNDVSEYLSAQ